MLEAPEMEVAMGLMRRSSAERGARRRSVPENWPTEGLSAELAATERLRAAADWRSSVPVPGVPREGVPDSRVMRPPLPAVSKVEAETSRREPEVRVRLWRAAREMVPPVRPDALMVPVTEMLPLSAARENWRAAAVPSMRTLPERTRNDWDWEKPVEERRLVREAVDGSEATSRRKVPPRELALLVAERRPWGMKRPEGAAI